MKKTIFVLGNLAVSSDKSAVKLLLRLKKNFPQFNFRHIDPTEGIDIRDKAPVFIDTVVGIKKVEMFDDLHHFLSPPTVTVHDYDLYQELALLKKIKKIESFEIIGIPEKGESEVIINDIRLMISRGGI